MKLQLPTRPLVADEARLSKIRYLVLNFRKQSLTPADHLLISSWLDESETNQQLFEKWIVEPRSFNAPEAIAGKASSDPMPVLNRKRVILLVIILTLAASLLLFLLLR